MAYSDKARQRTYTAWYNMRERCDNPNSISYKYAGGRGITYSKSWTAFDSFLSDMGDVPEGLTLERSDNDGNYCRSNCRWATPLEQAQNRRIRVDSMSGIPGVVYSKAKGVWRAYFAQGQKYVHLYEGKDFFEACCRRKSWEASMRGGV